jgi:hypothetical protein
VLKKSPILSILPSTLFAFQQTRSTALHRFLLLWRAAIFGHEEINGLQDCLLVVLLCREEIDVRNR